MPNLVGIGLSQVPTNSMLGGLAYQDPEHASIKDLDLKNLSQINSEIADTAVDVFVYDTSKDSDGGAWRKRTTHTSWYNETLGTATRGSRKEFPSVAVIVLEATQVTIYDGDDPDLPMWMVFNQSSGSGAANTNFLGVANVSIANIFMLNGILCVAFGSGGWGVSEIGFVSDSQKWWWTSGIYKQPANTIAERHVKVAYYAVDTSASVRLSNANIRDLEMAVQPNAKVDIATRLPIPTIALGTEAQAHIITTNQKSEQTVVELTGFSPTDTINIDGTHVVGSTSSSGGNDFIFRTRIPSSDEAFTIGISAGSKNYYMNSSAGTTPLLRDINHTHVEYDSKNQTTYRGGNAGFDVIVAGETLSSNSSKVAVAYATTSFNSGYMVGNIKNAFLSDTDTTNLVYTDILGGNGTFDDASYWTVGSSWTVSGGVATSNSSGISYLTKNGILTTGVRYVITLTVSSYSAGTLYVYCGTGAPGNANHYFGISANGTRTMVLDAYNTNFGLYGANFGGVVDNLTISSVVDQDRSVNGKHLGVIGTVTRSAVATGAELVAYSGFSGSNVLYQQYDSNLDPGTGDYSFMIWFKCSSTTAEQIFMRRFSSSSVTGGTMMRIVSSSSVIQWYVRDTSSTATAVNSSMALDDGNWHCAVGTREGSTAKLYIDGELNSSSGCSANSHDPGTDANLAIGAEEVVGTPGTFSNPANVSSLALIRYSLSAPSAEQVKKMYEDEKVLFQENAKCTLYGSSNTVTGLAFDESTDRLHVGTSSGRSDFQGLRRINNTTTAVTTSISAHDGFIIEQ